MGTASERFFVSQQVGLDRVIANVGTLFRQVGFITDDVFVIIALPEAARTSHTKPVEMVEPFVGGEGFKRPYHIG